MTTKALPRCLSDMPIPAEFYAKPKAWLEVVLTRIQPTGIARRRRIWIERDTFNDVVASALFTVIILREVDQKP